ncbi:MAG: exodeoxyribonuclease VII large subunit [Candidatus Sumerlaeaceae bacterium]
MRRSFIAAAMSLAVVAAAVPCSGAEAVKTSAVTKDKLGQQVTVEGKTSSFRASRGEKSPSSFMLKDSAGEVRIVIWPDIYGQITGKEALEKDGTQVTIEGEVAEYREKIELHLNNASGVKISSDDATTSDSSGSDKTTTSAR